MRALIKTVVLGVALAVAVTLPTHATYLLNADLFEFLEKNAKPDKKVELVLGVTQRIPGPVEFCGSHTNNFAKKDRGKVKVALSLLFGDGGEASIDNTFKVKDNFGSTCFTLDGDLFAGDVVTFLFTQTKFAKGKKNQDIWLASGDIFGAFSAEPAPLTARAGRSAARLGLSSRRMDREEQFRLLELKADRMLSAREDEK